MLESTTGARGGGGSCGKGSPSGTVTGGPICGLGCSASGETVTLRGATGGETITGVASLACPASLSWMLESTTGARGGGGSWGKAPLSGTVTGVPICRLGCSASGETVTLRGATGGETITGVASLACPASLSWMLESTTGARGGG